MTSIDIDGSIKLQTSGILLIGQTGLGQVAGDTPSPCERCAELEAQGMAVAQGLKVKELEAEVAEKDKVIEVLAEECAVIKCAMGSGYAHNPEKWKRWATAKAKEAE